MRADPWLQRWLPLLRERAADATVLEIGCGHGDDTATLAAAGLRVLAFDRSALAIAAARLRVPRARISRCDIRDDWPEPAGPSLGAVVASLSLHYFAWDETIALVARIRARLRDGGVLLCRLNSTRDLHFGASGHAPIEPNYYQVDGQPKRFFDEAAIARLFDTGWRTLSQQECTSHKYPQPKVLWEVVLERTDGIAPRER